MNVVLYTIHCPQCVELENLLARNNIKYTKITDIKTMKEKGFVSIPMLTVGEQTMTFEEAKTWIINNYKGDINE